MGVVGGPWVRVCGSLASLRWGAFCVGWFLGLADPDCVRAQEHRGPAGWGLKRTCRQGADWCGAGGGRGSEKRAAVPVRVGPGVWERAAVPVPV